MAKISKTVVDKALRESVFYDMFQNDCGMFDYVKINDRQYGVLIKDMNGVQRYIRIGAIVSEEREDMTAEELMQSEIAAYNAKQADKEAKAQARAEKAKKDKERRAKEKEEKENE
jgi:hypothetical protein